MDEHTETTEPTMTTAMVFDLGDAAELTLGTGRSTQEAKRHIYN